MNTITSRDLARHAKLFELLRQQNIAREMRLRVKGKAKQTLSDRQTFKKRAEQSLSEAPAVR